MSVIDVINRLKSEILPNAVYEGRFGIDKSEFIDFIQDEGDTQDQFQSEVIFGDVVMTTKDNETFNQSVAIKVQPFVPRRYCTASDIHFYNELLFYNEIAPFLQKYDDANIIGKYFPRFFFGIATSGQAPRKDILIFENLQKLDYKLTASRSFISYDHIKLTLESIAGFHSLSLVSKKRDPDGFKNITSKIVESTWTDERVNEDGHFLRENCKRGILPFQDDPEYVGKLRDILTFVKDVDVNMKKLVTPAEPLSVICHGDLCRNNIFYRYDINGKPVGIKFFDLATVRYSSPVIDLSFLLFMNSSPEVRSRYWQDILETYHTALVSNPDLDKEDGPSFEEFQQDFQRRGFYGYAHCSFFLPMMMESKETLEDPDDWATLTVDEMVELRLKTGGDEATQCIARVVKHMIDEKFDFKYITSLDCKD